MYIDIKTMREVSMGNPDITERFFKDMRRLKPLTSERQTELIKEYAKCKGNKKRQEEIRDELVLANQPFIVSMARHLATLDDFNDLVSEGNMGLMRAIKNFDANRDNKFLTYAAYHIRKAMTDYQINIKRIVKPKNVTRVYAYSEDAKNKFFIENGRFPSDDELVYVLDEQGINFNNKEDLHDITVTSLDRGFMDEDVDITTADRYDDVCYTRTDGDKTVSNVTEHLNKLTTHQLIEKALSYLTNDERDLVCKYYGIGHRQMTPTELAMERGYGLEDGAVKIEKLINKSIKKIRKHGKIDINVQ